MGTTRGIGLAAMSWAGTLGTMPEATRAAQEQSWLRDAAGGDAAALAELYAAHAGPGLRLATRVCQDPHLAEDAVHAAFLDLVAGRVRAPAGVPARAWLLGVIAHKAQQLQRAERARHRREGTSLDVTSAPSAPPVTGGAPDADAPVWQLVRALPEAIRTPLLLHVLEAQPFAAIAQSLGRNEATIRSQVWRATQELRRRLRTTQGASITAIALWRQLRAPPVVPAPPWPASLTAAIRAPPLPMPTSEAIASVAMSLAAVALATAVLPRPGMPPPRPASPAAATATAPVVAAAPAEAAWIEPVPTQTLAEYACYVAQLHQAQLRLHPAVLMDLRLLGDLVPEGVARPSAPSDAVLLPALVAAAGDVCTWQGTVLTIAPTDATLAAAVPAPARSMIDRLAVVALRLGQTPGVEAWPGAPDDTVRSWLGRVAAVAPLGGLHLEADPAVDVPLRPRNAAPGGFTPLPPTLWTTGSPPPRLPRATLLRLLTEVAHEAHAVLALDEDGGVLIPARDDPPGSIVLRTTW